MSGPTQQQTLEAWKKANPELVISCGKASHSLQRVFNAYIKKLTDELIEGEDSMIESDYMLNDFVDRYGIRAAHMCNLITMLDQLGTPQEGFPPRKFNPC